MTKLLGLRLSLPGLSVLGACLASLMGPTASAGTVDFTDGVFALITDSPSMTGAVSFSETVDGATLTLTATDNLVGGGRFLGIIDGNLPNGLHLGGGGGSTLEFTLSSDRQIDLERYATSDSGFFLGSPEFNVMGPGVSSTGNTINAASLDEAFASGPLTLQPNVDYTFTVANTGAAVQGFVSSFTISVPEPSSFGLLAMAAAAGLARRR